MRSEARRLREQLGALGVQVRIDGDDLRIRAPRGVLDPALQQQLRDLKPQLRALLGEEQRRAPLTGAQRQLWFGEQQAPGHHAHHLVIDAQLAGPLDPAALRRAFEELVARHEALRTRIESVDGVPAQVVVEPHPMPLDPALDEHLDPVEGPVIIARLHERGQDDHRLRIRIHHLVIDGASLPVLLEDLAALYLQRTRPPITATPRQIARRLQAHEASESFTDRLGQWVDRLEHLRPLELPGDRPPQPRPSSEGGRVHRTIVAPLWAAATALARTHDTTAFTVLAAILGVVMGRWTGTASPCLGIPHAGRTDADHEGVVGMFVDTTLLAVELGDDPSFTTLLARTRDAWLACLDHTDLPLDRVIAERHARGCGAGLPDVTLNFIPFGDLRLSLPGIDTQIAGHMPGARFDLTIYAYPRGETLDLEFAYRSGRFDPPRMEALADQLHAALRQAVAEPERPVRMISLATTQPPPRASQPRFAPAAQPALLEQLAAVPADRSAVVGADQSLDYGQLCARAKSLTAMIRERGLGPGQRIAILGRRDPALIVALLGVWGAGNTAVLLDAAQPPARCERLIAAADPQAWIAIDPQGSPLATLRERTEIPLPAHAHAHAHTIDWAEPELDAVASIALTSGTTGEPKVVRSSLAPLLHFFAWYRTTLEIQPDDRFALLSGLGHDPALRDMLGALLSGATVHVPPDEPARLGPGLARWIEVQQITTLHLTPAVARMIAATATGPLHSVRRVLFGGDRLRGSDVAQWRALAPHAALFNVYGTTETPQVVACHRITAADAERDTVPLGRPIDGVSLELCNPAGHPTGLGEIGEIIVHGDHLALDHGPRYATGDLGRWRPDGEVDFVGRLDRQLQIRGLRIEPAEVERALLSLPHVREAMVAARSSIAGEPELMAWVVGPEHERQAVLAETMRQALALALPAPAVPSRIIVLDALPLTPRGKIDHRALSTHSLAPRPPLGLHPRVGLEPALAAIWADLLQCGEVARHDDFFARGGHSLRAVELVARIQSELGITTPVATVFEHPTLAAQAAALVADPSASRAQPTPLPADQPARASVAQQRLWLLDSLEDGSPQLRIDHEIRRTTALDRDALDRVLVLLEQRHEPLRTTFELHDDALMQRVQAPRTQVLEGQPPHPLRLSLDQGPVWRAFAWTVARDDHRLRLIIHHAAADGGAMEVLCTELVASYQAHRACRPVTLPAIVHRYAEIAAWQHQRLAAPHHRARLDAWRARLADITPLELPLARARPSRQRYRGARADLALDPTLVEQLDRRARETGATSFMVLLTAVAATLARWAGTDDLTIGTPVGLRPHPAAAALVGPFLNLVVHRIDASGDPSLRTLLGRVRARALEAFAGAQIPFERVLQAVAPARTLDRTPLFQVLFNMVEPSVVDEAWARLEAERVPPSTLVARYDLAFYVVRRPGGSSLSVIYDRDLFEPAQMQVLLDHVRITLEQLATAPQCRLAAVPLPGPAIPGGTTTPTIPNSAGSTTPTIPSPGGTATPTVPNSADSTTPTIPSPGDSTVFDRFARIAAEHGDAPAVRVGDILTDYAALLARAHSIVAALAVHGPGARIGLLLDPNATMAATMLAVLAGGQVYVPLDAHLPAARLRAIVRAADLTALAVGPNHAALATTIAADLPRVRLDTVPTAKPTDLPAPNPDHPAYILHTSGSTGRPKGVVQSQTNLLHHALTYATALGLAPGDRISMVATLAFDAAVMDIFGALLSGACLHPLDLHGDGLSTLATALHHAQIEVFHATPTVFREVVAQIDDGAPAAPLRWVVLGGEQAHGHDAAAVRRVFGPGCGLINGLGPTECTLALQHRLAAPVVAPDTTLPIGRPVDGVEVRLCTPVGEQVAPFGVGEIELRSAHLALEYWRRPEATAAVFTPAGEGRTAYRTGDRARIDPDGTLTFVGRRDDQVKIRGRRVELGEIEAQLRAAPGVREAAVRLDHIGDAPRLRAWFVPRIPDGGSQAEIDAHLRATLPPWMIPSALLAVPTLPRTPTGKLDRRALAAEPIPTAAPSATADGITPDEAKILQVWSSVLGEPVLRTDVDWFACGGDSLTAIRLGRALQRDLGLHVSLAALFEGVTVAHLAARVHPASSTSVLPAPRARASLRAHPLPDGITPLVCVLPPGARPRMFDALARHLGPRLWILQPPGFGLDGPLPTLDDIAQQCLSVLPPRHLHLAGMSNGGLLALAIAQRWPAAVPRPLTVSLLDTLPPTWLAQNPWSARSNERRRASFVADLCGHRVEPDTVAGDVGPASARIHAVAVRAGAIDDSVTPDDIAQMARIHDRHGDRVWRVLSADEPLGPVIATAPPIHLIEATVHGRPSLVAAWRQKTPHIRQHAIPGDHLGILDQPHVLALVRALHVILSTRHSP